MLSMKRVTSLLVLHVCNSTCSVLYLYHPGIFICMNAHFDGVCMFTLMYTLIVFDINCFF